MSYRASRAEVIAFRLGAHHLVERLDEHRLLDAAGRCGVQNTPPGSGPLALHARVRTTGEHVTAAVAVHKSLLQSWCMRGAPFFFPVRDASIFTTGVLPPTERALRYFVRGVQPALDQVGLSLPDAVTLAEAEITDVLSGRRLAIDELGAQLAARIVTRLPARQREAWQALGPYAPGQQLGEGIVHFCVRILTLQGVVCFAPRDGNKAPFVLVDEWLGRPFPTVDAHDARAELLRRYLRSYGPSTRADFAAWLGLRAGDVGPWWSLVEDEMCSVDFSGTTSWMLTHDLDTLKSSPMPTGVRLLPPHDPYTQMRDRRTIVEPERHSDIWRSVGEPGAVLAGGEIVGTWRARSTVRALTIAVTTFRPLSHQHNKLMQDEAEQVALMRGASRVHLTIDGS